MLIQITRKNHKQYINPDHITALQDAAEFDSQFAQSYGTYVEFVSGSHMWIDQTPSEILSLINKSKSNRVI